MKNIVISDEFNELDLKPSELLETYIQMVERDVRNLIAQKAELYVCPCPACDSSGNPEAFQKFGLSYRNCSSCGSLYVSPRPDDAVLRNYYITADSRTFWHDKLSKATYKKRKEKIIKPRFEWVRDSVQEFYPGAEHWADVNTGQCGYIEEMLKANFFRRKTLVEPYIKEAMLDGDLEIIGPAGMKGRAWDKQLEGKVDVVTLFEVVNRRADNNSLFENINRILKPGGLCFLTVILSSGFDIQVLWGHSKAMCPPDRLNIFSVDGLKRLFRRHWYECLEFSTPGILDVEIVSEAMKKAPLREMPRFVKNLIEKSSEDTLRAFQEFLQANLLSSYGRVLLKKNA